LTPTLVNTTVNRSLMTELTEVPVSRFEPSPDPSRDDAAVPVPVTLPAPELSRVRHLVAAALVAAFMSATGWIAIPFGPVPITLQLFGVLLAALLLSWEWAAAALAIYLVMGTAGIPVFSMGTAGLGVVLGPTGGYVIGFVLAAPTGAWLRQKLERRGAAQVVADVVCVVAVIAVVYLLGWVQLAAVTNMGLAQAFVVGVVPFIVPDAIKAAGAIAIATAVRRSGVRL
jgi:biotin transport system substrate-specific component